MRYITDKSKIKNGMFVSTQDGAIFVRIGKRLSKIDIDHTSSFADLKQEEIKTIFKANGKPLMEEDTNKKIIGWKPVTFIEYGKGENGDQYETGVNYEPIYEEESKAEAWDEEDYETFNFQLGK